MHIKLWIIVLQKRVRRIINVALCVCMMSPVYRA